MSGDTSSGLRFVVVLGDGETWGEIDGASVLVLSPEQVDDLETGRVRVRDVRPLAELGFRDWTGHGGDA